MIPIHYKSKSMMQAKNAKAPEIKARLQKI